MPRERSGTASRRRPAARTAAALAVLCALVVAACGGDDGDDPRALHLVSLGDSLAVGVQPGLLGGGRETRQGYPRQLADLLRDDGTPVVLHELGCGGATSASLLAGGRDCAPERDTPYANEDPTTSQASHAIGLLSRLGDRRRAVLLDIGGNDVGDCLRDGRVDPACLRRVGAALRENLDELLGRLRDVAPDVPIGVLTLYDPLLGLWDEHPDARPALRRLHVLFLRTIDRTIVDVTRRHGATVVDLADAMHQYAPFRPTDRRRPQAVAAICDLTWMCVRPPRTPDIHLRREGYRLAAEVARRALGGALRSSLTVPSSVTAAAARPAPRP
ncbi:SGNH/GDSL hydrolase family protein [Patulibacter brassicae]|uniref:SGNH/GDSL hydrolase family protein n=1 Tax=Patulibacter brassicae TaxID=1705717 RepID=A0ABU4VH85_9ACTN|nr:SGNH/GDSL hydrolase family protein [Patulibacter brassicae]MDX8151148.1 SGNH/GDSL hydrolase family protein [Patulibacter brassicae]